VVAGSLSLGELAERIGGSVVGDASRKIRDVATLGDAGPEEISFLTNPRYRSLAEQTRAGAVMVKPGTALPGRDLLVIAEPYLALVEVLEIFHPPARRRPGVHADARVDPSVVVGKDVEIGPFAVVEAGTRLGDRVSVRSGSVVGERCTIGDDTVLMPRVVVYPETSVGARCVLHSGVVLGGDGFGFATSQGVHHKIPQVGRVVVEDDVEIGANSAVDRATVGETVIGAGTKIDDLVMVAHGVRIGPGCLLVAQSGVAGSARVGSHVTLAGQSGLAGHVSVGDRSVVAAKTAVFDDKPAGSFVAGIPAIDNRRWKRAQSLVRRLPELRTEIRRLEVRIAKLERRLEPTQED
jgi:UDP-3-O-[3-hydroxymyristoyl] glucosamine N-acyltransferase